MESVPFTLDRFQTLSQKIYFQVIDFSDIPGAFDGVYNVTLGLSHFWDSNYPPARKPNCEWNSCQLTYLKVLPFFLFFLFFLLASLPPFFPSFLFPFHLKEANSSSIYSPQKVNKHLQFWKEISGVPIFPLNIFEKVTIQVPAMLKQMTFTNTYHFRIVYTPHWRSIGQQMMLFSVLM